MEHLSRRTAGKIDVLFLVSDATVKGLRTIHNLLELADHLKLAPKNRFLIVNRVSQLEQKLHEIIDNLDIEFLGAIPEDKNISEFDLDEKPLLLLPDDSPAVKISGELLEKVANQV
jgi:CO dehydrogenase maturation factor